MKSYHANSGGGLASLVVKEHPVPEPSPYEVLVRVRASSLNAREFSVLAGTYPLPVKPDVVMCADGAGEVVAVGANVTRVEGLRQDRHQPGRCDEALTTNFLI
jgi:NADPH:quinone reductase-like Zn-dependent oxidoreductase